MAAPEQSDPPAAAESPRRDEPADTVRCPVCGRESAESLEPGVPCAACLAASPWSEIDGDEPVGKVVVTRQDIEEAETRRLGFRPKTPFGQLSVKYLLPALAGGLGVGAVVDLVRLWGPQELSGIATILTTLGTRAMRITIMGAVAMVLGTVLLVVLKRSRLYRSYFPLVLALAAVPCGVAGTLAGGFYWLNTAAYPFKHASMPPIPKKILDDGYRAPIARAMVVVFAPDPGGDILKSGLGSGTVVSRKGDKVGVLTCSHVALPDQTPAAFRTADPSRVLYLTFSDGRQAKATIIWTAPPPVDLAMLEADLPGAPAPVVVSRSADSLKEKAEVTFSAHPYRHGWRFHKGKILKRRVHNTPAGRFSLIISDLPAEHGDSGSGMYDARGRLVGVITWKSTEDGAPRGISLPSDALIKYFKLN